MHKQGWVRWMVGLLVLGGCSRTARIQENGSLELEEMEYSGELIDGVRVVHVRAFMFDWIPNPIVLKAGEPVKLVVSSNDTIHGIAIPEFKINKRLVPGYPVEIELTVPQPGIYDFFCSVVCGWGHNSMTGYLLVLGEDGLAGGDLELDVFGEYGRFGPGMGPSPRRRQLIKNYRFEDLQAQMDWPEGSRSYATGKQLFVEMTCSKCHTFDGSDDQVGSDLSRDDLKLSRRELLREVLEPSRKIDEKHRQWILIADGLAIVGLILKENDQYYLVDENPGETSSPTKILKEELEEDPEPSDLSLMPSQLLDTMTVEEIQDLLAYVHAKGDPRHAWFEKGTQVKDSPAHLPEAETGVPGRGRG